MAYKGSWFPKNIEKYKGDHRKITYRSNWEKFMFNWLDSNPDVYKWGSETVIIPYYSRADGKKRRYYMDLWVKFKSGDEFFFEVKPAKETVKPAIPSKMTATTKKRYINDMYTFMVNEDKWSAAQIAADKMNIKFRLITEKALKRLGYKGV